MNKNIADFLKETIIEVESFEYNNLNSIREMITKAITYYELKSYEEIENTDKGTIIILHLHSMIEENLLSKVVELSGNGDEELNIEGVYRGRVYRHY